MKITSELVQKAADFSAEAHSGVKRKYSGEPYFNHPARVAAQLALLPGVTEIEIAAALLHDTLEDCATVTSEILKKEFGVEVMLLVQELTNPSKNFKGVSRDERKAMDREHVARASVSAKHIKILDRLDNLPLDFVKVDPNFARKYALESRLLADAIAEDLGVNDDLLKRLYERIELLEADLRLI